MHTRRTKRNTQHLHVNVPTKEIKPIESTASSVHEEEGKLLIPWLLFTPTAGDIIWLHRSPWQRGRQTASSSAMVILRLAPSFSLVRRPTTVSMQHSDLNTQRKRWRQPHVFLDTMDTTLCQSHKDSPLFPPLNQSVLAIICDDEPGTKLYPLTKRRSKSAIPVSAHYRIIDFVLGKDGFVEVLTTYQSAEDLSWFKGNADAVRRWLWLLEEHQVKDFLVLPGHHLYEMDYRKLIKAHRDNRADITIAMANNDRNYDASHDFLLHTSKNQFHGLMLAPASVHSPSAAVTTTTKYPVSNAENMGIYVIRRDILIELLQEQLPKANDFGTEVLQGAIALGMKVHAYMFDGHWNDLRNIEAFYQVNIESITRSMSTNFHGRHPAIYTLPNYLPPTTISNALIKDSIIGDGCLLNRCKISNSVIGTRTYVGDDAVIKKSVVMGSDIYEADVSWNTTKMQRSEIPVGIGEKAHVQNAIIDKNARIGKNVKIVNKDGVQECDREASGYIISGGIVVVLKNAVIPDDSIL
nr:PREDICTED: inactive glucose-1-phosphate adenylyltransferase small subunit 2, chloroplastic-like isoform X3 [Musa acuminata subsp. malaccensis]